MEVWKCLAIIRKPERTWLFGKEEKQNEKLAALVRLSEIGHPAIIRELIPLIKNDSEKVRNGIIQTVAVLFEKLKGKKAYYDLLKYSPISQKDILYYQEKFDEKQYSLLMKISSLNRDGRIRESAVRELGKSKKEDVLPFIIFRLADWVPNVREAAKKELRLFLKPEFQQELIDNLSLFNWLQKVERADLSKIYDEVIDFLVHKNRSETLKSFYNVNDKERRILALEVSKSIQSNDEISLLLNDKHFLIRILVLNQFNRLTDNQKEKLLHDKSARVRQSTLYKFKEEENFEEKLPLFLADKSGTIRYFSRYHLREKNIDFKELYTTNLSNEKQLVGSLLGLLDIEAKDCDTFIEPYLESDKIRVVKTAFYVFSNLNPNKAFNFAKENLFTNQIGLRNAVIEYFGKNQSSEILEIARNQYQKSEEEVKLSILRLFSKTGGYAIFPDLLIGSIDEIEIVRNQARLYLQKWKNEAVSMFSRPKKEEKSRAIRIFNYVDKTHAEKGYFVDNPVEKLDFFIK